jgi:hypothetical protein
MADPKGRPHLDPAILERLRNAPPGSAIARAREAGIDVGALAIRLSTTTPLERLEQLDRWIDDMKRLRAGME